MLPFVGCDIRVKSNDIKPLKPYAGPALLVDNAFWEIVACDRHWRCTLALSLQSALNGGRRRVRSVPTTQGGGGQWRSLGGAATRQRGRAAALCRRVGFAVRAPRSPHPINTAGAFDGKKIYIIPRAVRFKAAIGDHSGRWRFRTACACWTSRRLLPG